MGEQRPGLPADAAGSQRGKRDESHGMRGHAVGQDGLGAHPARQLGQYDRGVPVTRPLFADGSEEAKVS
ncbi:hypothetical protein GTY68_07055 [Streptomyces sp. SID4926]|nr:hypothetical protein [Streptomyces sp. SID4926]